MIGHEPVARLHQGGDERQSGHSDERPQSRQPRQRPEHRLPCDRPASLLVDDMERPAQVVLGAQSAYLWPVLGRALERHEAQPPVPVQPGQAAGDPRADSAAPVVEDRQTALAHDARRRVGCTWMRTG
jgi:hypothetical protein